MRAFDWCQNQQPWMTSNKYFTCDGTNQKLAHFKNFDDDDDDDIIPMGALRDSAFFPAHHWRSDPPTDLHTKWLK